ncbi:MAG: glycoside hydrolase family 2 TIM barrel-domain containing protein [Planctomycetota bacterium]
MKSLFATACALLLATTAYNVNAEEHNPAGPSVVEIQQTDDGWQLIRNGEPFYIKGMGGTGNRMGDLAAIGGNALRTWGVGPNTGKLLDDAHANGIAVILNIWLPHSRGENPEEVYTDPQLLDRLRNETRSAVEAHKNHPALLAWSLGNESEAENVHPAEYWAFLEELAALVQDLDPNHPVMTTTSELARPDEPFGQRIRENCPSIDIWGINSYGGMFSISQRLAEQRETGWNGPHIIMEFGPLGQWEVPKKFDVAPIEQSSTEKALQVAQLWNDQIVGDPNCLGGFGFLWGQKQEETHTWFGIFVETRPTGIFDTYQRLWTGSWPDDRAPSILDITPNFDEPIAPGSTHQAEVTAFDPEGKTLKFGWHLELRQPNALSYGKSEKRPQDLSTLLHYDGDAVTMTAPSEPGVYRLFILVEDPGGKVATANTIFKVE